MNNAFRYRYWPAVCQLVGADACLAGQRNQPNSVYHKCVAVAMTIILLALPRTAAAPSGADLLGVESLFSIVLEILSGVAIPDGQVSALAGGRAPRCLLSMGFCL